MVDVPAADQIEHQPRLLRRGPDVLRGGVRFNALRTRLGAAPARRRRRRRHRRGLVGLGRVALEQPRRRELAELVPDHVLGHVDRDELPPVVHGNRVPHHLGDDRRPARPGLDDLLVAAAVHDLDLLEERHVDERTLLQ